MPCITRGIDTSRTRCEPAGDAPRHNHALLLSNADNQGSDSGALACLHDKGLRARPNRISLERSQQNASVMWTTGQFLAPPGIPGRTRILQRLESKIAVESQPGHTEFRVSLPLAR